MKTSVNKIKKFRHKRRAVAGLISIIAIMFTFSFATLALLQLESKQVSFFSTVSEKITIQSKSSSEEIQIAPSSIICKNLPDGIQEVTFLISNKWEDASMLDSVLFLTEDDVAGTAYVSESTNKTLSSLAKDIEVKVIVPDDSGNPLLSVEDTENIFFITELGTIFKHEETIACTT